MTTTERIAAIRERLTAALKPTQLEIMDEGHKHVGHAGAQTGRGHFKVVVASPKFTGKSKLACHRMVYAALAELMQTDVHALSLKVL